MPVLVTKTAPDFTAAALFHGKEITEFTLSAWKGKYIILLTSIRRSHLRKCA